MNKKEFYWTHLGCMLGGLLGCIFYFLGAGNFIEIVGGTIKNGIAIGFAIDTILSVILRKMS